MTDGFGYPRPQHAGTFDQVHTGPWPPAGPDGRWQAARTPPGPAVFTAPELAVLDGRWDPEEELARLLSADDGRTATAPPGPPPAVPPPGTAASTAPGTPPSAPPGAVPCPPMPAGRPQAGTSAGHRRPRLHGLVSWQRLIGWSAVVLTAAVVAAVSVLSGLISYGPLHRAASPEVPRALQRWWPLLVYGPWLVGSFSVLRAALYGRRAAHAWIAVVFFSAVAVLLCVGCGSPVVTAAVVAGLPAVAAPACFYLLVRQVTLNRPLSRPVRRHRRGTPRH